MSELKRCPFCGGEAIPIRYRNGWDEWWQVHCTNCHISQTGSNRHKEEEAVEEWNTRKPVDDVLERLEELYKYNAEQADIYMDANNAYMREKKEMYMDRANCYGVAIRTVKEGLK